MSTPQTVSRDEMAMELAASMVEQRDVMRKILRETIRSAKMGHIREAGRTKCPRAGEIRGSLQRFPRAIDLASCPAERGGTWHTHVTEDEIRTPTNSLPDMANVMFGLIDASVVVGTQTADVIVAPQDREGGKRAFQNAIGANVSKPREITAEIKAGRIAPGQARMRARQEFPEMVFTVETGFSDLDAEVGEIPDSSWAIPPKSGGEEAISGNGYAPTVFAPQSIEAAADRTAGTMHKLGVKDLAISKMVGNLVDRSLFK